MTALMYVVSRVLMAFYFAAFFFALGKFTYFDGDGYGFFIPNVGGYHVSTLEY